MNEDEVEITVAEMLKLNSLSREKPQDASFIRILLEVLYKDNLRVLLSRSFTGRTSKANIAGNTLKDGEFKAISPIKKKKIFSLFRDRIMNANVSAQEKFARLQAKHISRLISVAITNIRRQIDV